ncbi:Rrf2 family transcriptional regulator [Aquicoccus porphyridii]|uniref:Rrf2 family transcriptional regulator n=1 Tax=Aquicoccus porphyridii TaxID=1852029 RepID=UPI00273E49E2|nr:Rrf2 family transcriptional regulator [Aquicoccus porphyridii]
MTPDLRFPRVLHVLIHLSLRDRVMSSAEIAKMLTTNPVVVRRMLAGLRDNGLIEATKGRSGGWRAAKPLDDMSMRDVFDALRRPDQVTLRETRDHPGCPVEEAVNEALHKVEAEAAELICKRHEAMSLGDIARAAMNGE